MFINSKLGAITKSIISFSGKASVESGHCMLRFLMTVHHEIHLFSGRENKAAGFRFG